MQRHILDKPRKRTKSGLKIAYSRIEAKQMPKPATLALQRRPRGADNGQMVREFARIERGQFA